MAFEALTDKFSKILKKLKGQSRLTEKIWKNASRNSHCSF